MCISTRSKTLWVSKTYYVLVLRYRKLATNCISRVIADFARNLKHAGNITALVYKSIKKLSHIWITQHLKGK